MVKLSPSILAADFANLERDIHSVESAEFLHIDVMDGLFVPNLSVGIPVVQAIRKVTDMTLDVHLMIVQPGRYAERFIRAGADLLTIHLEADSPEQIAQTLRQIRDLGCKASLSIKPATPAEALIPYLPLCDMVLVMTVEPGFGGQAFLADQLPKIRTIAEAIRSGGYDCLLQVDGSIDRRTAPLVVQDGANVLVAGTSIFSAPDRQAALTALRVSP